jgi:arsenate reductase (thioredoxin)
MSKPYMNVLFICTGNSARSIMAEALLNQLGGGKFRAYSAGSHPAGFVNPKALELLERNRFRTGDLRSKNWDEFAGTDAPQMDFVLTVCDKAAGEVCPVWPGQPMSAHWGVEDPAAAQGTPAQIEKAFTDAFMVLQRRIALFLNLPLEKLEKLSLLKELQKIGQVKAE